MKIPRKRIVRPTNGTRPKSRPQICSTELHYLPFVVAGACRRPRFGTRFGRRLLASEDLIFCIRLAGGGGYVAVASENRLLYQTEKRASEMALLKEFNESIVESSTSACWRPMNGRHALKFDVEEMLDCARANRRKLVSELLTKALRIPGADFRKTARHLHEPPRL